MSTVKKVVERAKRAFCGKYDENGCEIMDKTKIALKPGFHHPPSLQDQIARIVRHEISQRAQAQGLESFEEADDFDVDDEEMEMESPYEQNFDHDKNVESVKNAVYENRKKKVKERFIQERPAPRKNSEEAGAVQSDLSGQTAKAPKD